MRHIRSHAAGGARFVPPAALSLSLYQKIFGNAMFFSFRTARQGRGTAHTGAASRPKLSHSRFFQRKRLSGGFSASSCRISRKIKAGLLPSPQSQKQSIRKESQYFFKKTLDFLLHPCYDNEAVSQEAHGVLAQLGERHTGSVEVSGSIPLCSTKIRTFCECMRFGFFIFRQNSRGAVISDGAPADVFLSVSPHSEC